MSRKKKLYIICSVLVIIALTAAVLCRHIAISASALQRVGGDCFAVVFDKAAVMSADRIVMREGEKVVTITDKALVREIASEFVVANRTALCGYHQDKWMEIYNGDKLVRNIHWNDHDHLVEVYEADATHWIIPGSYGIGQIELSDELVAKLAAIMAGH